MNLYLVEQSINNGYDTYDSVIIAAENESDARLTHPSSFVTHHSNGEWMGTYKGGVNKGSEYSFGGVDWVSFSQIDKLEVKLIGTTNLDAGVVLASFSAG